MPTFEVTPQGFRRDGAEHRVLSGAVHYFRVHPGQWAHRLAMVRALGLNTVETYVPWNLHEPEPGAPTFDGIADLDRFLGLAADAGLDAIVRPGPYICAEWDNGGLPAWLQADREIPVRRHHPAYLEAVDRWFDVLVPRIAARQVSCGGNVVMVQVENEYGSFGSDPAYLEHLRDGLRRRGIDVPLFTSDGPSALLLSGGTLPGTTATVNFGDRADEGFGALREHRPDDPPFCMEFWNGWFDHWGEEHTVRSPQDAAAALEVILRGGASVNIYMAHGGTNFGLWAGANADGPLLDGAYQPTVTSYDYDAPIDEAGEPTAKYWALREVLGRYTDLPPAPAAEPRPVLRARTVDLSDAVRLFDVLDVLGETPVRSTDPPTFEELGLRHGLLLHRATLPGPRPSTPLRLRDLRDRAQLFVYGTEAAVLVRDGIVEDRAVELAEVAVDAPGARIELLVEAMGRVNYGPLVGERKGVLGGVFHGHQLVLGWETVGLGLEALPELPWSRGRRADGDGGYGPVLHRGEFDADDPLDAYLSLAGWAKGVAWVNGFCLGRFWDLGPQQTLYVPGPVLRRGPNEVVILDLHPVEDQAERRVAFVARPDLGPTTT